jgi:phosphoglycolate phosphatase/pyrophosphatase PpaX
MIKAVIFDMDGTLGDTLPLIVRAFREAIEPHAGRAVSDEEILATFGPSEEGTIIALIPEHYEQGLKTYFQSYTTLHAQFPEPFDGIKDLLQYLKSKQIKLGLVTGKGAIGTDITLRQYGLENVFDEIETGRPEGPRKPQALRAMLKKFGLAPTDAVYIGDAPSDITACDEVGIPIISAAWAGTAETETLKEMNPDATFESVEAFGEYLKSII